ncbi:Hpt domain-containing protein [Duganella sp. LX20W]|uniref:Hpt domain-containing protein n=1 Tax=Rugamonas brunnea TaxID=2758569 RepID=A0A7W2ES46_9BURK|nr:Hpt domain-containing protein [Rugamonas brunnea]MBA5637621.1 Hpt domain-containing protein [Rugamonas brunnea]
MNKDAGPPVLDLEDASARNGVQRPLLLSAARAFAHAYGNLPPQVTAHLAAGELAALGQAAHRVKGAATLLGAYRLGAAAAALEEAVRAGDPAHLTPLTHSFATELEAALAAMRAVFTPNPPDVATPSNLPNRPNLPPSDNPTAAPDGTSAPLAANPARHAAAARLTRQLVPLLRDGDYAAAALLDQLDGLLAGGAHAPLLAEIRQQFDDLETEQAVQLAERLGVALG